MINNSFLAKVSFKWGRCGNIFCKNHNLSLKSYVTCCRFQQSKTTEHDSLGVSKFLFDMDRAYSLSLYTLFLRFNDKTGCSNKWGGRRFGEIEVLLVSTLNKKWLLNRFLLVDLLDIRPFDLLWSCTAIGFGDGLAQEMKKSFHWKEFWGNLFKNCWTAANQNAQYFETEVFSG